MGSGLRSGSTTITNAAGVPVADTGTTRTTYGRRPGLGTVTHPAVGTPARPTAALTAAASARSTAAPEARKVPPVACKPFAPAEYRVGRRVQVAEQTVVAHYRHRIGCCVHRGGEFLAVAIRVGQPRAECDRVLQVRHEGRQQRHPLRRAERVRTRLRGHRKPRRVGAAPGQHRKGAIPVPVGNPPVVVELTAAQRIGGEQLLKSGHLPGRNILDGGGSRIQPTVVLVIASDTARIGSS
ncbi:hypothetical protein MPUL_09560 [Mycolicibacterium pulveris]|uniref:Uncharacterized protein n=1 Tax=Mycolicibacterium pulveris TaxID=36813 RepID=A0A7I7UEA3_MYCPV|nr:hypothetical protein MPUL_09560 [Mycolicibacterium pulveris]